MSMSVEEAMDMDPDSDHDDDLDAEGELDDDEEHLDDQGSFSVDTVTNGGKFFYPREPLQVEREDDGMDYASGGGAYIESSGSAWQETVDPRRRPRE